MDRLGRILLWTASAVPVVAIIVVGFAGRLGHGIPALCGAAIVLPVPIAFMGVMAITHLLDKPRSIRLALATLAIAAVTSMVAYVMFTLTTLDGPGCRTDFYWLY